jgi:hypothetical protein
VVLEKDEKGTACFKTFSASSHKDVTFQSRNIQLYAVLADRVAAWRDGLAPGCETIGVGAIASLLPDMAGHTPDRKFQSLKPFSTTCLRNSSLSISIFPANVTAATIRWAIATCL